MKLTRYLALILIVSAIFTACTASAAEPAMDFLVSQYLDTEYTDAASLRNQLAFGVIELDGTADAITPEQAGLLIPLWQALVSLSGDSTTTEAELTAIQDQIVTALTIEQLEAIALMQLTNADLDLFYAEYGIIFPTPVPGVTKVPGSGNMLSQEEREATKTAAEALGTPVGTGSSSGQPARTLLFEKTIEYLQSLLGQ